MACSGEALGCPSSGHPQTLIWQHSTEAHPETDPCLPEDRQGRLFEMAFCGAGLQSRDQWPQLVDCLSGPPSRPGQLGQADRRFGERDHRHEIGVCRVGDPQQMRGYRQGFPDMPTRGYVMYRTPARLDHRDVGLVVAQDRSQLLLGQTIDPPVGAQDLPEIARAQRLIGRMIRPVPHGGRQRFLACTWYRSRDCGSPIAPRAHWLSDAPAQRRPAGQAPAGRSHDPYQVASCDSGAPAVRRRSARVTPALPGPRSTAYQVAMESL